MMIRTSLQAVSLAIAFTLLSLPALCADKEVVRPKGHWPQWRGLDRLNLSPDKGLLSKWPKDGPPLVWQVNGIGEGVGSVAVAAGKVYILGHRDKDEHLTAIDEATGRPLWSVPLGPSHKENPLMRWLSQRTPLIDDGRVYSVTAKGDLTCVRADTGKMLWKKDYAKDFEGRRGSFGVCDQLLVDGDKLIGVPGGKSASVVALNKKTGETVWKCPLGDTAAYVGAVLVEAKGVRKHYVAVTAKGLVGVSTEGKELWRNTQFGGNIANACTPNVLGNKLFCVQNYGRGAILLELADKGEGVEARQEYHQALGTTGWNEMVACVGDHAYVGANQCVCCLELKTGKILWKEPRPGTKNRFPSSGTWADGRLYLRTQQGSVQLVKATPEGYSLEGNFQIPDAKQKPGATAPVVTGGRLYLRDEDRLFCHDVLEGSKVGKPAVFEVPAPGKSEDRAKEPGSPREADAIYVPTPQDVVEKMLEVAKPRKTETLVDLGCGDGRIVVTAARKYECKAIGYDIDPACVKLAQQSVKEHAVGSRVTIERKDMFTVDLSKVDVVALYLPSDVEARLLPQLERLPAGARVVCHAFAIPGRVPDQKVTIKAKEDGLEHTVFLYTAPLQKTKKPE